MNFEKYPFEKLNELLKDVSPNSSYEEISLTIGEPQFETPKFIQEEFCANSNLLNKYPKSSSQEYLKDSLIEFFKKRFNISLNYSQLIPTFGTREVLFNFPQFYLFDKKDPVMAFTNPFYQIYEGAAIASRAKVFYLNLNKENSFKPLKNKDILKQSDLVIINFPNNPTSSTLSLEELKEWVELALEYDFLLINDECYSELYFDKKPPSLLNASIEVKNSNFKNILVLNSISKRSSSPGLRSGVVAGDETILKEYLRYRTYVGCAIPLPLQKAAAKAWQDEEHVDKIREIYKKNFELAKEILGVDIPQATFYIWLEIDKDKFKDELIFTKELYRQKSIKVLPGRFLGREEEGKGYVRIALVYSNQKTKKVLEELKDFLDNGYKFI